jgi:uncharacterized protein YjiS (DUF1127 family)
MDRAHPIAQLAPLKPGGKVNATQIIYWLEAAFRTLRERRQLMQLDARLLHDIGINRAEAEREWSRPFWDVPKPR